jgi:trehalose-phosphatase
MNAVKALELLPAVDWHKGRATEWIRSRVRAKVGGPLAVVYLGDDRTDEDAFDVLGPDDVAIGVGDRPHTHLIDWRLAGPDSVGRFFGHLARLRG